MLEDAKKSSQELQRLADAAKVKHNIIPPHAYIVYYTKTSSIYHQLFRRA